jgi:peptide-methionine (S)-S-oxide reductase
MKKGLTAALFCLCLFLLNTTYSTAQETNEMTAENLELATFGAGCFWCVEAIFEELNGVSSVVSGYAGGNLENPSYEDVLTGKTGHAEVCQITYDPKILTFSDLLMVFWQTHDPTSLNRQGNDIGTQYRSVIFYHTDEQKMLAEEYKRQVDLTGTWSKPLVTEITSYTNFYKAEKFHQEYFDLNPNAPYCKFIIQPKLDKFKEVFKDKLK